MAAVPERSGLGRGGQGDLAARARASACELGARLIDTGDHLEARHRGLRLRSAFQPITSLTHHRIVGYEALLRASDVDGRPVAPDEVFGVLRSDDELADLDRLACALHVHAFARQGLREQWLFVNLHAGVLTHPVVGDHPLPEVVEEAGMGAASVVVEVLEDDVRDDEAFRDEVDALRERGHVVAIDDFGRGHSNLDRILRATPDIVKLDLSITAGCRRSATLTGAAKHLVSLFHELGALVLAEGIETEDDAVNLAAAGVDLLQGYWLGRPSARPGPLAPGVSLGDVLIEARGRQRARTEARDVAARPFADRLRGVALDRTRGAALSSLAAAFLREPRSERFFVLDADGGGIGPVFSVDGDDCIVEDRLAPLRSRPGNDMSRRDYFQLAVQTPGVVAVAGPYYSFIDGPGRYCVALAQDGPDGTEVLCGSYCLPP